LTLAERFGRNLFMARRRAGLSQERLAASATLHRTEIGLLERGLRLPRLDTIAKLAAALGIEAGNLLAGVRWEWS
jgi:transcriptional regulator with XRE-family HTH domain